MVSATNSSVYRSQSHSFCKLCGTPIFPAQSPWGGDLEPFQLRPYRCLKISKRWIGHHRLYAFLASQFHMSLYQCFPQPLFSFNFISLWLTLRHTYLHNLLSWNGFLLQAIEKVKYKTTGQPIFVLWSLVIPADMPAVFLSNLANPEFSITPQFLQLPSIVPLLRGPSSALKQYAMF